MQTPKTMKLIAFLQAQNCSSYTGSWRNPASPADFLSSRYFERIARTLEDGRFDMAFFDDRLAMPDTYGRSHEMVVRHGIRPVKMDPAIVLAIMSAVTTNLGLGATYSTTYHQPFHVARLFATLDLMSGGRAAWNIVTSLNDSEAANFGVSQHTEHDLRYDRADEFLEIVTSLWSSWDWDAIVADKEQGVFADPQKVHRTDFSGKLLEAHGTFTVPRSDQGQPVLIQAGTSGRGLKFAARWAEVMFTVYANKQQGIHRYAAIRQTLEDAGRDPDSVTIAPSVGVVVAESETLARKKFDFLKSLARPEDAMALLSDILNFDFSGRPFDEPFTDKELERLSSHAIRDVVVAASGRANPSFDDFVRYSGIGSINEDATFIGTPAQVADQMEEWFGSCCNGFVFGAYSVPGTYEDLVRLVVPELQRRGLARKEYSGTTLRENLGLGEFQRL
jgi:FMN-dependent oxidoreductase (nitrilotriacetate monooxygenase family)